MTNPNPELRATIARQIDLVAFDEDGLATYRQARRDAAFRAADRVIAAISPQALPTPKCPACDGTKVVSQGGHDTGCDACYVDDQTPPPPSLSTDVQSAATGCHEHDVSLKAAMPVVGEAELRKAVKRISDDAAASRVRWTQIIAAGGATVNGVFVEPDEAQVAIGVLDWIGPRLSDALAKTKATVAETVTVESLATVAAGDDEGVALAIEAAAKVCDERAAGRIRMYEDNQAEINAFKAVEAEECAAAIRLLLQGGGNNADPS
jgi:hypothetical protein